MMLYRSRAKDALTMTVTLMPGTSMLSALDLARRIEAGEITPRGVVDLCAEAIAAREKEVGAFVALDLVAAPLKDPNRFRAPFQETGREAWENAKKHPVSATVVTALGLAAAGALFWAVHHFRLVEQVRDYLGF